MEQPGTEHAVDDRDDGRSSSPPSLEVRGLTVSGWRDGKRLPIAESMDLHVQPPESFAILSPTSQVFRPMSTVSTVDQ